MRGRIRVDRMIDRNDRIAEGRGALSEIKNGINATLPEGLWLLTDRGLAIGQKRNTLCELCASACPVAPEDGTGVVRNHK